MGWEERPLGIRLIRHVSVPTQSRIFNGDTEDDTLEVDGRNANEQLERLSYRRAFRVCARHRGSVLAGYATRPKVLRTNINKMQRPNRDLGRAYPKSLTVSCTVLPRIDYLTILT